MTFDDIYPYVVGLALSLAIYGSISLIARLVGPGLGRLLKRSTESTVAAVVDVARGRRKIPSPYEYRMVPGTSALAEWEQAKLAGKGIPVIIGGRLALDWDADPFWTQTVGELPEDHLRAAEALEQPLHLGRLRRKLRPLPQVNITRDAPLVNVDLLSDKPLEKVMILWLPARSSAEIPAYLNLGGWNACPDAPVMVAALRHWEKHWGAELVGITADTFDLRVSHRPATDAEAIRLAREQVEFCSDVVEDPDEMLEELAADLKAIYWWHFWWD